ncbi:hypothetical protein V8Z80_14565 [Orrella sp. JC864]|uniref:hypothetical protein n=1 Tax=Orrella sp. JC864 TaxID=3120298 RepID=UPI0030083F62
MTGHAPSCLLPALSRQALGAPCLAGPCRPRRQGGAALIEFVAGGALVLALGLLVLETAYWQLARQVVSLALLQAARAGATGHAEPRVMAQAFETALAPLLASGHGAQQARARVQAIAAQRAARAGLPAWRIQVLSPTPAHFADFARPGIGPQGGRAIAHDYQFEQHGDHLGKWPAGRGPRSGQTIFQANVLALRLTYLHQPLSPWFGALLRVLAGDGPAAQAMRRAGLLPITVQTGVTLQSNARSWPAWRAPGGWIGP